MRAIYALLPISRVVVHRIVEIDGEVIVADRLEIAAIAGVGAAKLASVPAGASPASRGVQSLL
jgi:hypothetical protein